MVDTTPKIALKKPEPNVDTNWGVTLNQSLDILDDAVLTANTTGKGTVTVTDDGSGNVVISGSPHPFDKNTVSNALIGADGVTVASGSSTDTLTGFRTEFVNASGSLQSQISSSDTLQEAYDNGNGIIVTVSGKPLVVSGTEEDEDVDFIVVGSGTFTEALSIGTGTTHIDQHSITTTSGIFSADIPNSVVIGSDDTSFNRVMLVRGRARFTRGLAVGRSTTELDEFGITASGITASGVVATSGCFTEKVLIGPPGEIVVISGSSTGALVTATGIFEKLEVRDIVRVGDPQVSDSIFVGINVIGLPEFGGQIANEDLGSGKHILEWRGPELVSVGEQITVSGEAVSIVIKDDVEVEETVLDSFGITAALGDFANGLTVSGVPVTAGGGLTETKFFFAPTTSGGPSALNTVVIEHGLITSWTQA